MATLLWMIVGGIIALLVANVAQGKREHKVKFRVKGFGNSMVRIGVLVFVLYSVIIAVYFVAILIEKVVELAPKFTDPTAMLVHKGVPLVFTAMAIGFIVWFAVKAFQVRLFKYTEQEQEIVNAENQKAKERLLRFLKVFRIRRTDGKHSDKRQG